MVFVVSISISDAVEVVGSGCGRELLEVAVEHAEGRRLKDGAPVVQSVEVGERV